MPSDRSKYQIAVLREDEGKGGSKLIHRIFQQGRKVFISKPINHFPLEDAAEKTNCYWNGQEYSPGAEVCANGKLMRCSGNGQWYHVGWC